MGRTRWGLMVALAALPACGSGGTPAAGNATDFADYPTLVGRFAEEADLSQLIAREAFIGADEFYVSYDTPAGPVYAGGNWSDRIDILAVEQDTSGTYSGPYILPLDYQQPERWTEIPDRPIRPRQLRVEQWHRFRESFFDSVLPEDGKAGVVMHFDSDDYFLYHNEIGNFEARLLIDKPADYTIVEQFSFADLIGMGVPQLAVFLEGEGIAERRVVFNTGDAGRYSLPFLYVDLDLPIAVFVRHAESPREGAVSGAGTQIAQSVGHVAHSHLGSLAVRPVSSIYRLLFVAADAAVETVRPTWLVNLESQPVPPINEGPGMDLDEWEKELDRITNREATLGTIDYLIDGEEYFTRLTDAISSARELVYIRTYIFDNDDVAERIGTLLKRRSNEGVDVKVLLDGLGTIMATGAEGETMPEDYVPPASVRQSLERGSNVDVRQARNPWGAGDHVKTTIIDNAVAFTGGMNIGREYRYEWHDLMVEVGGPVVEVLRQEFDDAWAHAGFMGDVGYFFHKITPHGHRTGEGGYPVRVLFTRTGNAEIFRAQLAAIRNAQRYIYVQNAYLTDDAMLYELARARKRGVDVRVILPLAGNHGPVNQSNILAANAMLEHGIRVFLYPGMSHVKAAVFDGWACFGSANWDKLSFRVNKELNLATSYAPMVDELIERLFDKDFAESVELTEPFPARWSDHLVEIVADYML
ncbi:MAG: phosphatidylserine/phosphatidylglycerophosphate/cardiolipin synthase family protein [Gammaproteobacteria bacterium]|nr:phosphatidylserine/phosphatidylglycerophosphate/cardiolipin synthase family protein [Gammaproteobacteria bacterium]MDH5309752.1 phosphatidylserine/phosphatidylglycerophosphate/cardiolipin synthase family protein [Gammaproteobacteria bacterium]